MDKKIDINLKICFYFPYHEVSGVPVLFFRLANHLALSNDLIKVFVIDYMDGVIANNLIEKSNLNLIPFVDGKSLSPPKDAILVIQSILPYSIRPELKIHPDTKMVFWNLHPDNLIPSLIPLKYFRNLQYKSFIFYTLMTKFFYSSLIGKVREFTELLNRNNGLWFMDQSNLDKTCKYLFMKISDVQFMPVPALESNFYRTDFLEKKEYLRFTWVGRLCDFKSNILIYTIKKLSLLSSEKKIKIKYSIIGEGQFKTEISDLNVNHEWFTLEMLGSIKPDQLDSFLLENTDVLTAMGTSALEGARLGIPTILLDISYYPINDDYKFRWLHESQNYDLAHDIGPSDFEKGNLTLNLMLDDILNNYRFLSVSALNYFQLNHSINIVLEKFINKVSHTKMKYSDIKSTLLSKSIIRRFYDFMRY